MSTARDGAPGAANAMSTFGCEPLLVPIPSSSRFPPRPDFRSPLLQNLRDAPPLCRDAQPAFPTPTKFDIPMIRPVGIFPNAATLARLDFGPRD
ncbi:hypothetical protein N9406_02375 [Verrucomicrobiales bacterium]|nr:hypothetical protein [Verrucomicrobiales bacterium]